MKGVDVVEHGGVPCQTREGVGAQWEVWQGVQLLGLCALVLSNPDFLITKTNDETSMLLIGEVRYNNHTVSRISGWQ
jgi:hypothetical protein